MKAVGLLTTIAVALARAEEHVSLLQVSAAVKSAAIADFVCDLCADSDNDFDPTGKKGRCKIINERAQKNEKRCNKRKSRKGVIRGCCPSPPVDCPLCPDGFDFVPDNLDGKCAKFASRATKNDDRCEAMKAKKKVQRHCCENPDEPQGSGGNGGSAGGGSKMGTFACDPGQVENFMDQTGTYGNCKKGLWACGINVGSVGHGSGQLHVGNYKTVAECVTMVTSSERCKRRFASGITYSNVTQECFCEHGPITRHEGGGTRGGQDQRYHSCLLPKPLKPVIDIPLCSKTPEGASAVEIKDWFSLKNSEMNEKAESLDECQQKCSCECKGYGCCNFDPPKTINNEKPNGARWNINDKKCTCLYGADTIEKGGVGGPWRTCIFKKLDYDHYNTAPTDYGKLLA